MSLRPRAAAWDAVLRVVLMVEYTIPDLEGVSGSYRYGPCWSHDSCIAAIYSRILYDRFVEDVRDNVDRIEDCQRFNFIEADTGKDVGLNVREKSKESTPCPLISTFQSKSDSPNPSSPTCMHANTLPPGSTRTRATPVTSDGKQS